MNQEIIIPKKKKWYRRKLFYILVVAGLVLISVVYGQVKKANQAPAYETARVERGTLTQTVDATGNVSSANELDLRFETSGRIGVIYKKIGDNVKKGEAIVDLLLTSLNASVAQASANVNKTKADLDKQLAGNTTEYIASMQAKLDKAKADLDQIKASSASAISDAEAVLKDAENDLKLAEGGEDSEIVKDAYGDMVGLLGSVQDTLADGLIEADNILGIDNTQANDEFEDYLSLKNINKLSVANNRYLSAKAAKVDADTAINNVTIASSHDQVDWAADTGDESLFAMKELLFAVAEVLENTIPFGDLSQSELDTYKTNIQTARASVSADYISLIDQTQAIVTAKNSYAGYQIAYDKAEVFLENTKSRAEADIAAYQALLDQAQANYNDAKNPPREVDLAGYRAALAAAQANLAQAVAERNKARIIAPLNGVVGKIDAKIGEYVSSQDIVVKLVSPHFEIQVDIPETDIVKIALGNEARIKLDAFGDEVKFMGKVTEIEQGETIIQDVVYYNVTLSLEDDKEHQILNGMTADVMFYTEQKEDALHIPQRAVRTNDDDSKYVRVLEGKELKEVTVKSGLRGDGGLIEIVEGLSEGQEVVLNVINDE